MTHRIARQALLMMVALCVLTAGALGADAPSKGRLMKKSDMWVLQVEGTPHEMGLQQGSLMKEQIRAIYDLYLYKAVLQGWAKQYGMLRDPKIMRDPRGALLAKARLMEKHIPAEYIEEMKGIAEGSGIPYEDVLIMAAHVDYFAILCSGFVAFGPETSDRHVVHGRNLDWAHGGLRELDEFTTVILFKPDKGRPFVAIGYPGIMGVLSGMNDRKISTELNFSMAAKEENDYNGTPVMVLMRMITQNAGSVDEAEKILRDNPRVAGYNILIGDGASDNARLVEITAKTVGIVNPKDGAVHTTNHFTSKELFGKNLNTSFSSSNTQERYNRLGELVALNKGKIDPDKAMEMMQDSRVKVDGTVQIVVFQPGELKFWVWARNRKPMDYVPFDLRDMLAQKDPAPF